MRRSWLLLVLLAAAACGSVPSSPPRTPPEAAPDRVLGKERGESQSAREEWFLRRLREADGTMRDDASARGARSWGAWSADHAPAGPLGKAASPLGARSWREIGPRNVAGRVLAVAFDPVDPNILWAGTAGGGFYRSADFGQNWTQIGGDHLPSLWIGAIAVDPNDPETLYLGTGEANGNADAHGGFGGLLKTVDGGQTFTRITLPESAFFRVAVSTADSGLVLVAAKTGLYRSADAGGHFTRTLPGQITDFAQDPKNPSRFVAVRAASSFTSPDSGLFESLDAGLTWRPLGTNLSAAPWGRGTLAFPAPPSRELYLAIMVVDDLGGAFFRSADDGRSWERTVIDSTQGYTSVNGYGAHLAVAPEDERFVAQANGHYILVSRDAGLHWAMAGGDWHVDTHGIVFHPRFPNRALLATDGGVAVSADAGASFQRVEIGFPTVQFYTCAIGLLNPVSLFGGTQDNAMTIYRGDPGRSWERTHPPGVGDVTAISIHPSRTKEVLASSALGNDIGLSLDEGRTWVSSHQGFAADDFKPWVTRLARNPLHPDQVYVGGRYLTVSSDGGRNWQPLVVRPLDNHLFQIADLSISPADDAELWTVWSDGKVFVSEDAGAHWQERSPPGGSRAGIRISAGPVHGTAYAALSGTTGARLFRTRDGGATWDDISRDLPELPLNAVIADPRAAGRLFVATDAGVTASGDDGRTWHDASSGLPNAVVFDLCLDPPSGRLAAATYGRGLWELGPAPPCQASATTLCLNGGRFEVKAQWTAPTGSGEARAVPLTSDTGYFWFFDPANVEAVVKVIDGCGLNRSFWTFAGGLTNLQTVLTLRDTLTGDVKTYTNPQGTAFQPIQDVDTFPNCDVLSKAVPAGPLPALAAAAGPGRTVSGSSLLLNGERFKVDVAWETADGHTGTGTPVALTSDTGYFWFFAPTNVELVIKVLNGCGFNQSYWVFAGGLTDVRTLLTVTDTATGQTRTYLNPQKTAFKPIQDVTAFPGCP